MHAFRVDDMTCGHCVSSITRAIQAIDRDASVTVDLAQRLVTVQAREADARALGRAIAEAGYTPVAVGAVAVGAPATDKPVGQRSCCGCRG